MRPTSLLAISLAAAALWGCDTISDLMAPPKNAPLKGERIRVLATDSRLEADPRLAALSVSPPAPVVNDSWPQPGGGPSNAPGHVAGANLKVLWRTSVGSGSGSSGRVTSPPVVADGKVFTMDAQSQVTA